EIFCRTGGRWVNQLPGKKRNYSDSAPRRQHLIRINRAFVRPQTLAKPPCATIRRAYKIPSAGRSAIQLATGLGGRITHLAYRRSGVSARWRRRRYAAPGLLAGPVCRWTGLAPGHDVVDLVRIDGLVLQERSRHDVQLVEVGREQLAGPGIGVVQDAAHHLVDLACGFVGDALVLG